MTSDQTLALGLHYRQGTKEVILEEILKTEGVPYLRLRELRNLRRLNALFLGEMRLTRSQSGLVKSFVEEGGTLVVARPHHDLGGILGVEDTGRRQVDGFISLDGSTPYEQVSYKGKLQIFGQSRLYTGGRPITTLSPSGHAGIIESPLGKGRAFVVAFDVSRTFLSIQQPDSRVGRAYDTTKVLWELSEVPQLDLMRRLLVNLLVEGIDLPVPRKWYFPGHHRSVVLLGGDQDGSGARRLDEVKVLLSKCKAPYTLFTTPRTQPMSPSEVRDLARGGIEIALHPDFMGDCPFSEDEFSAQLSKARDEAGSELLGARNHALRWGGVLDAPVWMERAGVEYDSDLGLALSEEAEQKAGYFVGGGLPFFFIHPETFRRIDVLEQPLTAGDDVVFWRRTQLQVDPEKPGWLPDEYEVSLEAEKMQASRRARPKAPERTRPAHGTKQGRGVQTFRAGMGLTEEEAFLLAKKFMDDSTSLYFTVQCYCFHPVYLASRATGEPYPHSDRFFSRIVTLARQRGVRLMAHGEWNSFWRLRDTVRYDELAWDPGSHTLSFRVGGGEGLKELAHIVPMRHAGTGARIIVQGRQTRAESLRIGSKEHAIFSASTGEEVQVRYLADSPSHSHDKTS